MRVPPLKPHAWKTTQTSQTNQATFYFYFKYIWKGKTKLDLTTSPSFPFFFRHDPEFRGRELRCGGKAEGKTEQDIRDGTAICSNLAEKREKSGGTLISQPNQAESTAGREILSLYLYKNPQRIQS